MPRIWAGFVGLLMLVSCTIPVTEIQPTAATSEPTADGAVALPDLASIYCENQGYTLERRSDAQDNQFGVCTFPDGSECEEWAYYRGECAPANARVQTEPTTACEELPVGNSTPVPDEIISYINTDHGFAFEYPTIWTLEVAPQALKLTQGEALIYIAYKPSDAEWGVHWTGMPEGEWMEAGQVPFLGQMLQKTLLVFEGKVKVVTYTFSEEEMSAILGLDIRVRVDDRHGGSYAEIEIPQELQDEVERILASFRTI